MLQGSLSPQLPSASPCWSKNPAAARHPPPPRVFKSSGSWRRRRFETAPIPRRPGAVLASRSPKPPPTVTLSPDGVLLNVTASARRPDLATLNAGVVTQAHGGEAMSANNARMNALIAALKRSGVAERDIQT